MPMPMEIFEQAACEIDAGQIQQGAKLAYEAARQSLGRVDIWCYHSRHG